MKGVVRRGIISSYLLLPFALPEQENTSRTVAQAMRATMISLIDDEAIISHRNRVFCWGAFSLFGCADVRLDDQILSEMRRIVQQDDEELLAELAELEAQGLEQV